jgi:cellulose biosynthesis protein BcsQ
MVRALRGAGVDWVSQLSQVQLIWGTTGMAIAGLGAAFLYGRNSAKPKISELKKQLKDTTRENRQQKHQLAEVERAEREKLSEPSSTQFIAATRNLPPESVQVWLKPVSQTDVALAMKPRPVPILAIANLKGGVAKTMLASNLAAYFARRGDYPTTRALANKRVLLVDLDYQGSLSRMILTAMGNAIEPMHPDAKADALFRSSKSDADALALRVGPTPAFPRVSIYPTTYGFDDFETREQFRWLSNPSGDDVRFSLLKRLTSPEFTKAFDLIILDTGPRLTVGSVGALVAASHLLIPTAPDNRSMEAAERFLRRVAVLMHGSPELADFVPICPRLKVVGAVSTLTTAAQKTMLETARFKFETMIGNDAELKDLATAGQMFLNATLPRSQPVMDAAEKSVPYLVTTGIRHVINKLGAEVEERMNQ